MPEMIVNENTRFLFLPARPKYFYTVPKDPSFARVSAIPFHSYYQDENGDRVTEMRDYYINGQLAYRAALAPEINVVFVGI